MKTRDLRRLLKSPHGFTLLEAVISVGILAVVAGLLSASTFQVLSTQRTWRPNAIAVKELRHAGSVFAKDAFNASTTTLMDLGTPVASTTLSWTDVTNSTHTATYYLDDSGSALIRQFDGAELEVARNVVSAEFSSSGKTVTFHLEVQAAQGNTKSSTLRTYLRSAD